MTTRTKNASSKNASKSKRKHVDPTINDQIETLMNDLATCDVQNDKKRIRAKLRRLGHYGASRTPATIVTKIDAVRVTARKPDATDDQSDE
jgi:hypothetical protein